MSECRRETDDALSLAFPVIEIRVHQFDGKATGTPHDVTLSDKLRDELLRNLLEELLRDIHA